MARAQYTERLMEIQREFIMQSSEGPPKYMETLRSFGVNPQDTTPNLDPEQFEALIRNLESTLETMQSTPEDPEDGA